MEEKDIHKAPAEEHGKEPVRIFSKQPSCVACVAARRGSIIEKEAYRKPLIELPVNTTQKSCDSKQWARLVSYCAYRDRAWDRENYGYCLRA